MTISGKSPFRISRTCSTASAPVAQIVSVAPIVRLSLKRDSSGSMPIIRRAPRLRSPATNICPIGPCPRTATSRSIMLGSFFNACTTVPNGCASIASSSDNRGSSATTRSSESTKRSNSPSCPTGTARTRSPGFQRSPFVSITVPTISCSDIPTGCGYSIGCPSKSPSKNGRSDPQRHVISG